MVDRFPKRFLCRIAFVIRARRRIRFGREKAVFFELGSFWRVQDLSWLQCNDRRRIILFVPFLNSYTGFHSRTVSQSQRCLRRRGACFGIGIDEVLQGENVLLRNCMLWRCICLFRSRRVHVIWSIQIRETWCCCSVGRSQDSWIDCRVGGWGTFQE